VDGVGVVACEGPERRCRLALAILSPLHFRLFLVDELGKEEAKKVIDLL
jgi:hypothetical protein